MKQPLFLRPYFQEKMWGGQRLKTEFGYDIPSEHTGECWAISVHPHGPATITNGEFKGQTLDQLWAKQRELFGNAPGDVFPLLTKILDASAALSVQVHPDDSYALEHEHELGKTECWYVIAADKDSEMIYGHHAQTKAELAEMIRAGRWDDLLRRLPIKAGDFLYVPSGTIHAIGKGVMVLETQQSSDTTYRVYDFDRVDQKTGQKRALHIKQSIDVTNVPHLDPQLDIVKKQQGDALITRYVATDFFSVYKWELPFGAVSFQRQEAPYTLVSVLDGKGEIEVAGQKYSLVKGQHFILPFPVKEWTIRGQLTMIASEPGLKA
ncbi:mannose-6-phosphate isomerase, class I [Liquorilactobacillus capillatus]|uniref:Mannose-6-phosphate isomerase n=1 Tax=Liquorilactobacillus capillatus DSM 19910 TaxID=1423731 RepID=A0A0R1LXI9_9LACO|nr:mannose-6-phosphate isomerase, class I [Liquorilactobacillus capillatus]KRL00145.1 mannose-6-phosphate isomerase, class I [Liquorilactobacillus capillatus DSM 19910]